MEYESMRFKLSIMQELSGGICLPRREPHYSFFLECECSHLGTPLRQTQNYTRSLSTSEPCSWSQEECKRRGSPTYSTETLLERVTSFQSWLVIAIEFRQRLKDGMSSEGALRRNYGLEIYEVVGLVQKPSNRTTLGCNQFKIQITGLIVDEIHQKKLYFYFVTRLQADVRVPLPVPHITVEFQPGSSLFYEAPATSGPKGVQFHGGTYNMIVNDQLAGLFAQPLGTMIFDYQLSATGSFQGETLFRD
ncbi:hypothetical protein CPB83DRAFT_832135 [Crepidotus variabilis]|uniref:Uncharacterized protein n=1 Tax=Crepidotus variabilis TaxID=179855 RepID=A0A9P6EQT6_9AGAR|nr:hypothetical protein CPB83DRAFT_832135 [Crepidotus variabilis]